PSLFPHFLKFPISMFPLSPAGIHSHNPPPFSRHPLLSRRLSLFFSFSPPHHPHVRVSPSLRRCPSLLDIARAPSLINMADATNRHIRRPCSQSLTKCSVPLLI
ncbi:hypothetical protein Pfo_026570, partial [Paulownia fortunei]